MAKKKAQKINLGDMPPLSHNPFSNLGRSLGIEKARAPAEREPHQETEPSRAQPMLTVLLEKRKHGRVVTCIHHLAGDQKTLLKQLKQKLATGGTIEEGSLILQGDHRDAVCAFLAERGFRLRKARP